MINHNQKSFNDCNDKSPVPDELNNDLPPGSCDVNDPSKRRPSSLPDLGWLEEKCGNQNVGIGSHAICDPLQTGQIVNDLINPSNNTIYRYSKALRGCDEAMQDMFKNIVVIDPVGKAWPVPIIWATQERAVAAILQDNVHKDNNLVVDQIKLPMMAIHASSYQQNMDRYIYHRAIDYMRYMRADLKPGFTIKEKYDRDTIFGISHGIPIDITYDLYVWTMYMEDMVEIIEQIFTKMSPIAYIRVRGVQHEIGVKLNSVANNINVEPGDQKLRVIKYLFSFTAESYIPQPLSRRKAVLREKIDLVDNVSDESVTSVLDRLEEAVEELEE